MKLMMKFYLFPYNSELKNLFSQVMSLAFKKCKKICNIILVHGFCSQKITEISRFPNGFTMVRGLSGVQFGL